MPTVRTRIALLLGNAFAISVACMARLTLALARKAHRGTDELCLEAQSQSGTLGFAGGGALSEDLILAAADRIDLHVTGVLLNALAAGAADEALCALALWRVAPFHASGRWVLAGWLARCGALTEDLVGVALA